MSRPSLQRRLLWFIGLPLAALWIGAGAWLGQRIAHETGEMFDRELERTAASVLAVADAKPGSSVSAMKSSQDAGRVGSGHHLTRAEIVLRGADGRNVLADSTLPALPAAGDAPSFRTLTYAGATWRVYQQWNADHSSWVQLAAPLHDRDELRIAHLEAMLVPLAILLALLPLALWLGLRFALTPLRALSQAIDARPARTPQLTRDDVPLELTQLTRAVDSMASRLDLALQRERRFTADAAHELRHPLSILRIELDLAGVAAGREAREVHLDRARAGLARMERLVGQLMTLARVETLDHVEDAAPVSAAGLAREVLAEASERAVPLGIEVSLDADEALSVRASPGLLAVALRNLVENAIVHGRPGGKVAVSIRRDGGGVTFAVRDDGPGLTEAQAARLGERFLRGTDGTPGSGLGLSIAQAIARLHGGDLSAGASAAGGACVRLRLPRATDQAPSDPRA